MLLSKIFSLLFLVLIWQILIFPTFDFFNELFANVFVHGYATFYDCSLKTIFESVKAFKIITRRLEMLPSYCLKQTKINEIN